MLCLLERGKRLNNRNNFIDILKGICVIFVVIAHFHWTQGQRLAYLFPFWLEIPVPIFMIISGYVYALSFKRKNIDSFSKSYSLENTISKMVRYTIPFAIMYLVEIVFLFVKGNVTFSKHALFIIFIDFFNGGKGQGGYYYPVMMQFIFVFPIIYYIIRKFGKKGVIICGCVNALYELLQHAYKMNVECYRLLVFRYILVIAVGCYIALNSFDFNKIFVIIAFVVGAAFIFIICYTGYKTRIMHAYWARTSFIASLYIIPIASILIEKLAWLKIPVVDIVGKASYNIFLVQLVWYRFISGALKVYLDSWLHLLINVIACVCIGIIFYYIETPITKFIIRKCDSVIPRISKKFNTSSVK